MTNFDNMRKRLLQRAGIVPRDRAPYEGWTFAQLQAQECADGFCGLMDNRIVMGHLRYGPARKEKPEWYDFDKACAELSLYHDTGNTEHLVNAANYCRLEFIRGRHPTKHFHAVDRA